MQVSEQQYRKIVWAGGLYDLVVTFPFAFPGIVLWQLNFLRTAQGWLGMIGEFPSFGPFHLFFVNLFGSIVAIWAVLRIIRPEPLFGLFDGIGRALFSAWMLYYLLVLHIPPIVFVFVVPEVLFGIAQLGGYGLLKLESPA
jgi:hypothetical protein